MHCLRHFCTWLLCQAVCLRKHTTEAARTANYSEHVIFFRFSDELQGFCIISKNSKSSPKLIWEKPNKQLKGTSLISVNTDTHPRGPFQKKFTQHQTITALSTPTARNDFLFYFLVLFCAFCVQTEKKTKNQFIFNKKRHFGSRQQKNFRSKSMMTLFL